jgi:hypothetical protein
MRQLEIYRRRISPKELASLGWRRVDNGPMRTFQHRDGWLLEHCGHPTAIYPYLLVSPAGERVLSGAFSGQPDKGHAWATIALAADWVASLTPADARYYGGMNLSALYSKGIGDLSHAVQAPAPAVQTPQELAAAGESVLPPERRFVAVKSAVMQGTDHIATAKSKTMAKRIANALNKHRPNSEGV